MLVVCVLFYFHVFLGWKSTVNIKKVLKNKMSVKIVQLEFLFLFLTYFGSLTYPVHENQGAKHVGILNINVNLEIHLEKPTNDFHS